MSLEMWSQVKKYEDGESLDAATLNVPVGQLGERTDYLYARLRNFLDGDKMSAVILTNVDLSDDEGSTPEEGNAVYLDRESGKFRPAKATMHMYDDFTAADSAFTIGILMSKEGNKGDVIAYGRLDLNPSVSSIKVSNLIESTEEFRPGRYYLSANEAGKLSRSPNGPLIYVCTINGSTSSVSGGFENGTAIINPQFLDIGTSHVHRSAVLTARPAGTISVDGYLPDEYSDLVSAPRLRFGGTWTNDIMDRTVVYDFWLDDGGAWPNGVVLRWSEDGIESDDFKAQIKGPDEEVRISHGLTARLSLPASNQSRGYEGQFRWSGLEFPNDGRGWLAHEAGSVATSGDCPALRVAFKGRFDSVDTTVNIAFPEEAQVAELKDGISSGDLFVYGSSTFEFTDDIEHFDVEGHIPVELGTSKVDNALYLADALRKEVSEGQGSYAEGASFAVHQSGSLIVIDGDNVSEVGVVEDIDVFEGAGFRIPGNSPAKMVIFSGDGMVLSESPVVEGVKPYVWNDIGGEERELSVLLYQSSETTLTVDAGIVASAIVTDFEPDAAYDYVIGMDPQISNYWPPIPPKSAALMVNGVEMDNKALLPDNPTVSFGADTIHWFEDDEGRKPWPDAFVSRKASISPDLDKTEVISWVRGFQCASGPVTSIQVRDGSPLKIYGYGTNDKANVGDLEISADFDFKVVSKAIPGFNVPKRARNGKLEAGPVVERIIGGSGIQVVSQAGCPDGQGTVIVALEDGSYKSQFSDIALENAEQAKIGMFPYIRLKGYSNGTITSPSAFTATMRVPTSLPEDGKYALMVRASVFGESGFTGSRKTARVKLAYNILPDYVGGMAYRNLKTGLIKPDNERIVDITFGHQADTGVKYDGFDPILISTKEYDDESEGEEDIVQKIIGGVIPSSSDFGQQVSVDPELRPGYLVGIRFSRAVMSDSRKTPYTDPIGFINLSWSIVAFN